MAQDTTWSGSVLSEADITAKLMHESGAWTSWTPVVTQSNTPTVSQGPRGYARSARGIEGDAMLTITGAGTAANNVVVTMPVQLAARYTANSIIGGGWLYDASANGGAGGIYDFDLMRLSSTTCSLRHKNSGAASGYLGTSGFTAALANTDIISFWFRYEAVS